ncbi:hypothetical protein THZG08_630017 [Vibrio owensii]|uniref:Uncharacterized protein n=1 Tax=Vibrio owensii TaxID=696485 RepID=A0AAU9QDD5_9VIBR|nr:hypothetical protein THZG08_630017 [Vibrio owensii]CAH1539500.1 hypothetical protein THF1D04_60019 [Vibrio owensii]CAH1589095.1 hypothetical protein THOA03_620017 [Vibrio owensii]CAH1599856.1 hypothetical protein THOD04_80018 [Vibrio owensii]
MNSLIVEYSINSLNADLSLMTREYIPRLIKSGGLGLFAACRHQTQLSEWLGLRTKFTF